MWTGGLGRWVGIAIIGRAAGNAHVNIMIHLGLGMVDTNLLSDLVYKNDSEKQEMAKAWEKTYGLLMRYIGSIIC
ncbi:uncharacterized protein PgNI_08472 [Pyricularia grisea]|uniref:Uncharacterized protein n=1 Tax=Pyricularia grisea TaxID=148305 RepID=A0A6P8AVC2_PYRGI|nr:uncharacterized protein PgNI_08472 [Pyricularia grisea]TLD06140.1 hypothetical protein PgNI_08472 [Pyricularia grisea]